MHGWLVAIQITWMLDAADSRWSFMYNAKCTDLGKHGIYFTTCILQLQRIQMSTALHDLSVLEILPGVVNEPCKCASRLQNSEYKSASYDVSICIAFCNYVGKLLACKL